MPQSDIKSPAFHAAELRSERVRIFGVLAFLAIVVVVLTIRVFLLHTTVLNSHAVWNLALAAVIGLYEYLMLRLVGRALLRDREFPPFVWSTSTSLQPAVPAIAAAVLPPT